SLRCLSTFVTLGPRTLAEAGLGDERSAHRWATAFRLRWTIWMKLDGAGTAQKRQAPETVSDSSRARGLRGRGIPLPASGVTRETSLVTFWGLSTREKESFGQKSWGPRGTFKVPLGPQALSPKPERAGTRRQLT